MALGNILGDIAIQTVVVVVFNLFGLGKQSSLTYWSASLVLVLKGVLVVAVLTVAGSGSQLPATVLFARVTPASLLIFLLWVVGLWVVGLWLIGNIGKGQKNLPWEAHGTTPRFLCLCFPYGRLGAFFFQTTVIFRSEYGVEPHHTALVVEQLETCRLNQTTSATTSRNMVRLYL